MANYGEEIAYWYFRLNGFFPIRDFVIHQTPNTLHRSDIDILAIRPPCVYEEIGGQDDDWDPFLRNFLPFNRLIGIIVEVKTGAYRGSDLFKERYVRYGVQRLGLTSDVDNVMAQLQESPITETESGCIIAKILLAKKEPKFSNSLVYYPLNNARNFIKDRLMKYPAEKFRDRLLFPSDYLQDFIDRVAELEETE